MPRATPLRLLAVGLHLASCDGSDTPAVDLHEPGISEQRHDAPSRAGKTTEPAPSASRDSQQPSPLAPPGVVLHDPSEVELVRAYLDYYESHCADLPLSRARRMGANPGCLCAAFGGHETIYHELGCRSTLGDRFPDAATARAYYREVVLRDASHGPPPMSQVQPQDAP